MNWIGLAQGYGQLVDFFGFGNKPSGSIKMQGIY
jgi:hypothetical protein